MDLTDAEQEAMDATVLLANALGRVVGDGRTRGGDLGELFSHLHAIQHAIMAQPFARAHADRYRVLGESVGG